MLHRMCKFSRGAMRTLIAVGDDDELIASIDGGSGLVTDACQGGLHARSALADGPGGVQHLCGPAPEVHGLDGLQLSRPQNGLNQLQPAQAPCLLLTNLVGFALAQPDLPQCAPKLQGIRIVDRRQF